MPNGWPQAVATVRRSAEAFNARDLATALEMIHRDCVIVPVPNFTPPGAVYRGQAGADSYFKTVLGVTPDLHLELQDFQSVADRLLVNIDLVQEPGSPSGEIRRTAALYRVADRRVARVQGFATEAEAYEAAARPASVELQALFETAPAAVVLLDDEGRILDANAAACALCGTTVQALRGRNLLELIASEAPRRAREFWRAAVARGEGVDEFDLVSGTGERHAAVEVRARVNVATGCHMAVLIADRDRPAHDGAARLTPRERDVFRLLAGGLTALEIGDRLGISRHTVRTHVRNGAVKLDARTRVQAVALALASGEVQAPGELEALGEPEVGGGLL